MTNMTVRNVPDEVREVLREEARSTHRSTAAIVLVALQEYAEQVLRRRRIVDASKRLDALQNKIRRRRGLTSESAELLRRDRER